MNATEDEARSPFERPLAIAGVALVFVACLAVSWRRWPELLIDFGRELYLPWQVASGRVLYRDVLHQYGPLSVESNALVFRAFGPSLLALSLVNVALLALVTILVGQFMAKLARSVFVGALSSVVIVVVSGFGHADDLSNYDFVCPYSHELTHGVILVVIVTLALARWLEQGGVIAPVVAGLGLGLAMLTKPEPFLASIGVTGVALGLALARRSDRKRLALEAAALAGSAALPLVAFFLHFVKVMPAREAMRAVLGAFGLVGSLGEAGRYFYVRCLGLDAPVENAGRCLLGTVGVLLLVRVSAIADRAKPPVKIALFVVPLAAAFLGVPAALSAGALPLLTVAFAVNEARLAFQQRSDASAFADHARGALWAVASALLLAKLGLEPRLTNYGFALAMPALALHVARLAADRGPAPVKAGVPERGRAARALLVFAILLDTGVLGAASLARYSKKVVPVGEGPDAFLAYDRAFDPRVAVLERAIERAKALPEGDRFAVMPEGVALNYLARRPNGTPYVVFLPTELEFRGEGTIVATLDAAPPEWIFFVSRPTPEYGQTLFGKDYAKALEEWVEKKYERIERIGDLPFASSAAVGAEIWRLRR